MLHHYGAVVQDVDPDGPAAKIGIEGLEPNLSSISEPLGLMARALSKYAIASA